MKYLGTFFCGAVVGAGAYMLLHGLGAGPLAQYDEGTYAQVVQESFVRHNFLTFSYLGENFFDKPPLYFWLAGVTTFVTSNPILGIRLPAALSAFATVMLVMFIAYRLSREYWVAALAGGYLLAIEPFIQGAREARLDALIAPFIVLAFWAVWERSYIWFGVWVALAILTKSVIALFAIAALPIVALWRWEFDWLWSKQFWTGLVVSLAITLPWHLYEWVVWGSRFWFSYVGVNVLQRYNSNLFVDPNLQTDYWARLLDYARLELALFLLAIIILICLRHVRYNKVVGSVASLLAFMMFIFFSAQTRALSYLLPLYPFAALLMSLSASLFLQRVRVKVGYDTYKADGSIG